jgi:hypothetical protein
MPSDAAEDLSPAQTRNEVAVLSKRDFTDDTSLITEQVYSRA